MYPHLRAARKMTDEDWERALQHASAQSLAARFAFLREKDRVGLRILLDEYPEYVRSMVDQYILYLAHPSRKSEEREEIEEDLANIRGEVNTRSAGYRVRLQARSALRRAGITRHPSRPPLDVNMYLPRTGSESETSSSS